MKIEINDIVHWVQSNVNSRNPISGSKKLRTGQVVFEIPPNMTTHVACSLWRRTVRCRNLCIRTDTGSSADRQPGQRGFLVLVVPRRMYSGTRPTLYALAPEVLQKKWIKH